MPQEPKRRHSRQRKGKRRASIALKIPSGVTCSNCRNIIIPHTVCQKCGYYNGKQILVIKEKAEKQENDPSKNSG